MKEYFEKKRRRNRTKEKYSSGKPAKSCIANSSFKKSRKQIKRFLTFKGNQKFFFSNQENNISLKNEISQLEAKLYDMERIKDQNIAQDIELKKAHQIIFQEKNKNERIDKELKFELEKLHKELSEKNKQIYELSSILEEKEKEFEEFSRTLSRIS